MRARGVPNSSEATVPLSGKLNRQEPVCLQGAIARRDDPGNKKPACGGNADF